jgi:hypothetical protein
MAIVSFNERLSAEQNEDLLDECHAKGNVMIRIIYDHNFGTETNTFRVASEDIVTRLCSLKPITHHWLENNCITHRQERKRD